ncbi:hypothetical protein J6590_091689 [Homalodisca vitripennis]|nr:hypothetical protein J6590_091689 [Homalodisca vitripennis]
MTNLGRDRDCLCLKHNGCSDTVIRTQVRAFHGTRASPWAAEGTTITNVLVTSKGTIRGPTLPAVENEIKCADITGDLETKPVNVPNLVSTPSKPREKAGEQREVISH